MLWICLLALASHMFVLCYGNTRVSLDKTTCRLRNTYAVSKTGVTITWNGTQIDTCYVRLNRHPDSSHGMCVYTWLFNVSKTACAPNIKMVTFGGVTAFHRQFMECETKASPVRNCVTSDSLTLQLEANSSSSVVVLWVSTDTSYNINSNSEKHNDNNSISSSTKVGLPLGTIIGIMCGVFIPTLIIIVVVAVICLRRKDNTEPVPTSIGEEDTQPSVTNGNIYTEYPCSSATPLHRVTVHEEDDEITGQSIRLSVNV